MAKIAVVGTGYVGLVAGACFAELGHTVVCVDKDASKVALLDGGGLPIYEPGLSDLVPANIAAGRLSFTGDLSAAMKGASVVFIAVGTPMSDDGAANLGAVFAVAGSIGDLLDDTKVVVVKSTVPVGTCDKVRDIIAGRTSQTFHVVSNPEFLREGVAVPDFLEPDRIVIGVSSPDAEATMREVYAPLTDKGAPLIVMAPRSSEMTKYASNAMLATRISFMNEVAGLCERAGADVESVRAGMGSDSRIGPSFLRAGVGYGGSCFPKDLQALVYTAKQHGHAMEILDAVERVNKAQKSTQVEQIKRDLGDDLSGRTFALWGLAFKPDTDDMREAPAVVVAQGLMEAGAAVVAYDPEARETAHGVLGDTIRYAADPYSCLEGASALVLVTEWKQFAEPDWDRVAGLLADKRVYDGRNLWEPATVRAAGFTYSGIGRQ